MQTPFNIRFVLTSSFRFVKSGSILLSGSKAWRKGGMCNTSIHTIKDCDGKPDGNHGNVFQIETGAADALQQRHFVERGICFSI